MGGVGELCGIVDVIGEIEGGIEAFEETFETSDVGLGAGEHDHTRRFEVRSSRAGMVDLGVDSGEAAEDSTTKLFE